MGQAAILKSGICVNIDAVTNPVYTVYGFLNSFINSDGKKYRETFKSDFRDEDEWHKDAIGGFYQEEAFLKYLNKDEEYPLYKLKDYYYNFKFAEEGDEINVKKIKIEAPYDQFCIIETYKWPHQKNINLVDNLTNLIIIPSGVIPNPPNGEDIPLFSNTPDLFYSHHIDLFVNPLTDNQEKVARAYLFAKMALRINQIKKEIFQLFNTQTNTDFATYLTNQDNQWSTTTIFVDPNFQQLEEYYRNLTAFYKSAYANQILIQQASKDEKFYWLARCLTAEGLSIVPVTDKIKLLKHISLLKIMTEANGAEDLAIKIVESLSFDSVSAADRNEFLDGLLENQIYNAADMYNATSDFDSHKTLFEIVFSKIDDNRSARYTFGLFNTFDNRKAFILMLYKIWKKSKYNPKYSDPSYTQPANIFGVYPQSYYMELMVDAGSSIQKTKYYNPVTAPAFIYYDSSLDSSSLTEYHLTVNEVEFFLDGLNGNKIDVRKKTKTTTTDLQSTRENNQHVNTFSSLYGTYELYQPIAIIGFKPDLNLIETFQDPETGINLNEKLPSIPMFLLYYLEDYSSLKKLDFGIMMAAEIALNLTGVGALSDIRYLGYLSKVRAVWTGTATASETVLFWEAVEGVNALVQFTAGNLLAISNYVGNTSTDPDIVKFTEKVNVLLGILTLGSLLLHPSMKRKLFDAAADVLAQERELILLGKVHGLDIDTMNAIRGLYDVDQLIDLMQLKLNALPSTAGDTILTKFASFTRDEKYNFFAFFYNVQEEAKWTRMNFQYSRIVNGATENYTLVDIWKTEVFVATKLARGDIEFLTSFNRFLYLTNEIDKLKELKDINSRWVGGHFGPDLFDNTKQIFAFLDDSKPISIKQYGNRIYKRVANGIKMRKQGYINPNPNPAEFNGVHVKNKDFHTWVEGMSEREFLEEVSNVHSKGNNLPFDLNGRKIISSNFTDGCPVKIIVEKEITINGVVYHNYTTTILLNPKF